MEQSQMYCENNFQQIENVNVNCFNHNRNELKYKFCKAKHSSH